ncbi:MAG: hypothetical protein P4N59_10175 [Negativicutes bacterium]|nr:hypothetical protein [Negativicutes bacterium]
MMEIDEFWRWFSGNRERFAGITNDRLFLDLILARLKEIHNGLFFETCIDSNPKEFIVTASGNTNLFGLVDEIIARAPNLEGWKFVSLKPPRGFQFASNYRGFLFDPRKMWFIPLKKRDDPKFLGLRIGFEGGCDFAEKQIVRDGTLLVLDTGLGERIVATNIQYLEIAQLPTSPRSSGYGPVPELTEYISSWNSTRQATKIS